MDHIQLAYDLFVIMLGLTALSVAGFWAVKSRASHLKDFVILYTLFTVVLVLSMVIKYMTLNLHSVKPLALLILTGLREIASFGVLIAAIHFFHHLYQVKLGDRLTCLFFLLMVGCALVTFTPIGARVNLDNQVIQLGIGYKLGATGYLLIFTYLILLGFIGIKSVWRTENRTFVMGLLMFATVGWLETLIGFVPSLQQAELHLTENRHFFISSIPYALYGIFLIWFFLNRFSPSVSPTFTVSDAFVSKYGITDREREIIRLIAGGKSNADIAGELFISLATVKTHLHNIYRKLNIDSRFDLLAKIQSEK